MRVYLAAMSFLAASALIASPTRLHVVSTTDLHGRLLPQKGPLGLELGGIDTMTGYFDIARELDPDTIFLDSGDMFQGTIISNSHQGESVVKWMNYVGYTAAAIGNHEFDFGNGPLQKRIAEAKYSLLAANICSIDEDPERCEHVASYHTAEFAQRYLIRDVHGVKLGIIGLTTTATPSTTMPANVSSLRFMPLVQTLERFVPEMIAHGAQGVVVIVHDGNDSMFKVIEGLKPETRRQIPVIFAGHTHNYVNTKYKDVQVMITGSYGKSFGYTTLAYDAVEQKWTVEQADTVNFCAQVFPNTKSCLQGNGIPEPATFLGKVVHANPDASTILATDIREANAISTAVVGRLLAPLAKTFAGESHLGDFMTDAFRLCIDASCTGTADVAFLNNGGIRSPLLEEGPVTYGQVFELMPFDNVYTELLLSGRQIHDLLDVWFAYGNDSAIPQVSGLEIRYAPLTTKKRVIRNSVGETQTLLDPIESIVLTNGKVFNEDSTYRVVVSDFHATGGGGTSFVLKGLEPKPEFHYERKMRDELVDYFRSNPLGWDYRNVKPRILN